MPSALPAARHAGRAQIDKANRDQFRFETSDLKRPISSANSRLRVTPSMMNRRDLLKAGAAAMPLLGTAPLLAAAPEFAVEPAPALADPASPDLAAPAPSNTENLPWQRR